MKLSCHSSVSRNRVRTFTNRSSKMTCSPASRHLSSGRRPDLKRIQLGLTLLDSRLLIRSLSSLFEDSTAENLISMQQRDACRWSLFERSIGTILNECHWISKSWLSLLDQHTDRFRIGERPSRNHGRYHQTNSGCCRRPDRESKDLKGPLRQG